MSNDYQSYFNNIYDKTHFNIQRYIASKFHNLNEIEDILQEVYLEFYKTICKHGVNYISEPEAFLITIAKKKLTKHYSFGTKIKCLFSLTKANSQDEEYTRSDFSDIEGSYNNIVENLINREIIDEVWEIINTKDMETVEIFRLRYLEELQINDISKKMNFPIHTVKNKLYRTLEQIRQTLSESAHTSV